MNAALPVEEALPKLLAALEGNSNAVLVAPPGAGKTTLVPQALLRAPWCEGRVVVLEPRRIAARAAARRMAAMRGERVGGTVGLRVRLQTLVSPRTRIEVVTEGVFTRLVLADPALEGISAVILDEFHERSLDADLALALALDAQTLRPDLRLLAMSATLDGARVAALMEAETVQSEGRAFPVTVEYRERPPREPVEDAAARAVREALATRRGSILAFLPGRREIERTAERLGNVSASVHPLFGQLSPEAQDAAIRPAPEDTRKVVLATSIAETSLTIDGVSTVIDSGLARRPRFEPGSGLTRLETVRVSRAAAEQRAGRAGRTGPGTAIRLWREEQTGALAAFDPPEMLHADLAPLALALADWGVSDPTTLRWLDPPPRAAWDAAVSLLERLGALDHGLTPHGRRLAAIALPPRLAHMVATAPDPKKAALLAIVLQERAGGTDVDLAHRLDAFARDRSPHARSLRGLARRAAEGLDTPSTDGGTESIGATLARGFFDRVGRRGSEVRGRRRYRLANGRGAEIDAAHPLAREPYLVVAETGGRDGTIFTAAAITRDEIEAVLGHAIETRLAVEFDAAALRVRGRERRMLGTLELEERAVPVPPDQARVAILDGLRREGLGGLPWPLERERLSLLDPSVLDDGALLGELDGWLGPFLVSDRLDAEALRDALLARSGHDRASLDRALPRQIELASGERRALDYRDGRIKLHVRPQELFGTDVHPAVSGTGEPLTLVLLSPAGRPIQTTRDLPVFWRGSWSDVVRDMRGRYPRHPWPDEPWNAAPTSRAKPRKR